MKEDSDKEELLSNEHDAEELLRGETILNATANTLK